MNSKQKQSPDSAAEEADRSKAHALGSFRCPPNFQLRETSSPRVGH